MAIVNPTVRDSQLANEEWCSLAILDGAYSISSLGRLRRDTPGKATRPGRIFTATPDKSGYLTAKIFGKMYRIHRLVALAFLGPCPEGLQVNHINGIKIDNRAFNLEYCTLAENMAHANRTGLRAHCRGERWSKLITPSRPRGERQSSAKLTDEKVREIRRIHASEATPILHLSRRFGVARSQIRAVINRTSWKHVA